MNDVGPMQARDEARSADAAGRERYGNRRQPSMTLAQWLRWLSEVHRLFPPPSQRRTFVERDMRL
jgi:hypothetical protein